MCLIAYKENISTKAIVCRMNMPREFYWHIALRLDLKVTGQRPLLQAYIIWDYGMDK